MDYNDLIKNHSFDYIIEHLRISNLNKIKFGSINRSVNRLYEKNNELILPSNQALGNTFNKELLYEYGKVIAMLALKKDINVIYDINLHVFMPFEKKTDKTFSEDGLVISLLSNNLIKGIKELGIHVILDDFGIGLTEKDLNVIIDKRALMDTYLRAFLDNLELCIGVMLADNSINYQKISQSEFFKSLLENKVVISKSDLQSTKELESIITFIFSNAFYLNEYVEKEIEKNTLKMNLLINKAVKNMEMQIENKTYIHNHAFINDVLENVSLQGIVLLKNDLNILPLKKTCSTCFCGNLFHLDDLKDDESIFSLIDDYTHTYKFFDVSITERFSYNECYENIKYYKYSVIIIKPLNNKISNNCKNFLQKVINNNIVVVIVGDVLLDDIVNDIKTLLYLPNLGNNMAKSLLKILYGDVSPSGKLSFTWISSDNSIDTISGNNALIKSSIYKDYKYYLKYNVKSYFDITDGISFTKFSYKKLKLSNNHISNSNGITITFTLKNELEMHGYEISYLFIKYPTESIYAESICIKNFVKVSLKGQEEKEISFELKYDDLKIYNDYTDEYEVMNGTYSIFVGGNINQLYLSESISVYADKNKYFTNNKVAPYNNSVNLIVTDEEFYHRIGLPFKEKQPHIYTLFSKVEALKSTFITKIYYNKYKKILFSNNELIRKELKKEEDFDNFLMINLLRFEELNLEVKQINKLISLLNKDYITYLKLIF